MQFLSSSPRIRIIGETPRGVICHYARGSRRERIVNAFRREAPRGNASLNSRSEAMHVTRVRGETRARARGDDNVPLSFARRQ